jgi:hypothetical protein
MGPAEIRRKSIFIPTAPLIIRSVLPRTTCIYGGDQQHIWQAAARARFALRHTQLDRKYRPDAGLLAGSVSCHAQQPKTCLLIYHLTGGAYAPAPFSHAWLPCDRFDEVVKRGRFAAKATDTWRCAHNIYV